MVALVCDAIVVGSGAGGAWVAKELAEGGLNVILVEAGGRRDPEEFGGRVPDAMLGLYRDAGFTSTVGNVVIQVPAGRVVGGSTVVNMGTCFRPLPGCLRSWDVGSLEEDFEAVEAFLGVEEVPPHAIGRNGELLMAGLRRLGYRARPVRRNAHHDGPCGICFLGCPGDRKHAMHVTCVPAAEAAGATVLADTEVLRVLLHGKRAVGVRVRHESGERDLLARAVFVAAGALATPALLHRSGVRVRGLGRNLHIQPATRVAAFFDEEVRPWEGVAQSVYGEIGDGVVLEATVSHPAVEAMVLPLQGRRLEDAVAGWRHAATCGVVIGDRSSGRVLTLGPWSLPVYRLRRRDGKRLMAGLRMAAEALLAAGARTVYLPMRGCPPIRDRTQLVQALARMRRRNLLLEAFHPMSTAGMGRVTNVHGAVNGYEGLFVADASLLPTSLDGRNPQITIMALARRLARRYVAQSAADPPVAPDTNPPASRTKSGRRASRKVVRVEAP